MAKAGYGSSDNDHRLFAVRRARELRDSIADVRKALRAKQCRRAFHGLNEAAMLWGMLNTHAATRRLRGSTEAFVHVQKAVGAACIVRRAR